MQNLHQNELSCTSRFIGLAAATILLAASSTVGGNGWVMNRDQTRELETVHHDAMTPEQLARFLAHPNGHAGWYFIQSLADRGERAVPLLENLVNDEHPLVKQGAMAALIEIRKREFEDGDESTDTPATRRLISQMKPQVDDPSLAASIVEFLKFAEIDCADSREIAIKLSQSTELHLRAAAVEMATRFIHDARTLYNNGHGVEILSAGDE